MKNVALIPVRGGSKSIPLKNIKEICGKPLVYWTIKVACECKYIDIVYVSTDSSIIKEVVEQFEFEKVKVISRSESTATDIASTESVMLEFAEQFEFENIVLIQATSPLLKRDDLDNGFQLFSDKNVDSVLSVVKQKRFNWEVDSNGYVHATNYNIYNRPRRQEFDGYYVENGAFYITSKEKLLKTQNRISGNIKAAVMDEESFWEIDEPSDWIIIENIMKINKKKQNEKLIPQIKLFLTDCDGCLTDGGMYYSENGDELKKFNAKDGMAFKLLKEKGIKTGIVTGEKVKLNHRRAEKLKTDYLIDGCSDKLEAVKKLCEDNNILLENVAFVGDDINDLEVIKNVGFGCGVSNSVYEVKKMAKYITNESGGNGAIREVVDLILHI